MNVYSHDEPFSNRLNLEVRISINTAKLAKEAGFEVGTEGMFTEYITERVNDQDGTSGPFGWKKGELTFDSGYFVNNSDHDYSNDGYISYALPTQAELHRWLREEHKINVESNYRPNITSYTCLFVPMTDKISKKEKYGVRSKYYGKTSHDLYEDALEEGLESALKLILKGVNE